MMNSCKSIEKHIHPLNILIHSPLDMLVKSMKIVVNRHIAAVEIVVCPATSATKDRRQLMITVNTALSVSPDAVSTSSAPMSLSVSPLVK